MFECTEEVRIGARVLRELFDGAVDQYGECVSRKFDHGLGAEGPVPEHFQGALIERVV